MEAISAYEVYPWGVGAALDVVSISGANVNAPFDPNLSATVGGAGSSQGTQSSVSVTTTNAHDFIISFVGTNNGQTISAGSPFTLVNNLNSKQSGASAYDSVTTTQTNLATTFSWGGQRLVGDDGRRGGHGLKQQHSKVAPELFDGVRPEVVVLIWMRRTVPVGRRQSQELRLDLNCDG